VVEMIQEWRKELEDLHGRIAHRFARPGVDKVVSHESRHFADNRYKALIHLALHLARVAHALVAPYRNVHSFCATSFPTLPHGAFVSTLTGIAALFIPSY
jgi:hypothetical protein